MKPMSIRDVVGPIMVGPSSSHTAGALRIASMVRNLLDGEPVEVTFTLFGSFAHTYHGHGTDRALVAGMLGLHTDGRPVVHFFPCTGMHGGKMVFRGDVSNIRFPDQVSLHSATAEDMAEIRPYVQEYARLFGRDADALLRDPYTVVTPGSSNPYQQMYVAN